MSRLYTAADLEELAQVGTPVIVLAPGDLISPSAVDVAAARGIEVHRRADGYSSPETAKERDLTNGECTCVETDAVSSYLRQVVTSVLNAHPDADLESVTAETLKALGVAGVASIGSPRQAMPAGDRVLPAKAKGARPIFFADGGELDGIVSIMTTLASEAWALRERVDTLERLLVAKGTLPARAVDDYQPDDVAAEQRELAAAAYVARLLRVFDEMREQVVGDETWDGYMEVIRRAFSEL